MGGLIQNIFGTLIGAHRADRIKQENLQIHLNQNLIDSWLRDPSSVPLEHAQASINSLTKFAGKFGKDWQNELQAAKDQLEQERQKQPQLPVPQLAPPPNASYGPTAGGGIPLPPPPPNLQASGPPNPNPTPGQLPQPVVNGPMGRPRLWTPEERGTAMGQVESAHAMAGAKMNQQIFQQNIDQLRTITPGGDLNVYSPQQVAAFGLTRNLPYDPVHSVAAETNLVGPTGKTIAEGPDKSMLVPPGNWLRGGHGQLVQGPGQVVSTAPGAQTNIVSQPPPIGGGVPNGGGFSAPPPPPGSQNGPSGPSVTPVASVPPLPSQEVRTAWSAYAQLLGKKPADLLPDEQAKAVAWWEEKSNPLGHQVKVSTLETQAMNRAVMQNEMELANDKDTISMAATRYRVTGQLPPMGMRSTVIRAAILREAAQQAKAAGETPEQAAANPAIFKANQAALTDITKRESQVSTMEKTATKNLDVFLNEAQKLADAKSPILNQTFRGAQRTLTGGLAGFDAARVTAYTEISRVLSGSMGNLLSDSARNEANHILGGNYTTADLMRAAKVLKTDMKNRMDSFAEQKNQIRQSMGAGTPTAIPLPPGKIRVQIPGQPPGMIAVESKEQFLHEHPDGKVIQ